MPRTFNTSGYERVDSGSEVRLEHAPHGFVVRGRDGRHRVVDQALQRLRLELSAQSARRLLLIQYAVGVSGRALLAGCVEVLRARIVLKISTYTTLYFETIAAKLEVYLSPCMLGEK